MPYSYRKVLGDVQFLELLFKAAQHNPFFRARPINNDTWSVGLVVRLQLLNFSIHSSSTPRLLLVTGGPPALESAETKY